MYSERYQASTARMIRYTPVGSKDVGSILSRNGSRTVKRDQLNAASAEQEV